MMPATLRLLESMAADASLAAGAGIPRESVARLLRSLDERGLLDRRAAEAYYARREVDRLVRRGFGRMYAMEAVADRLCCSSAKVRKIIYSSTNTQTKSRKL